jgi:GNAT superfamily N-acetyltransferase
MQFFGMHNGVADIVGAIVAMIDDQPAGCGCFKRFEDGAVEMKRIFVDQNHRKKGVAKEVMRLLEEWAAELGNKRAVLETGSSQPEAIRLYESIGYTQMENFKPYIGVAESICYQKSLV